MKYRGSEAASLKLGGGDSVAACGGTQSKSQRSSKESFHIHRLSTPAMTRANTLTEAGM